MAKIISRMSDDEVALRKSIELDSHNASAHYNLGYLLAKDPARAHEAAAAYHKAIELEPNNARFVYRLGLLLHENLHGFAEAEIAYRRAIELEPNNARFVYRLGLLLHENLHGFAEAEIAYRRAIELAPADPYYYCGLVSLLVQQQRRSDALMLGARMRELLNVNENWYGLATLDAILGNVEEAIESLRKAADSDNFNREWARIDPDLAAIRGHDSFDEIVGIV